MDPLELIISFKKNNLSVIMDISNTFNQALALMFLIALFMHQFELIFSTEKV